MMFVPTSQLVGTRDLQLTNWTIIELDGERHIYGWCLQTHVWQLASAAIEVTDEYIQTRSRKYYKIGEEQKSLSMDAIDELVYFLRQGWNVPLKDVQRIVYKHSEFEFTDAGELRRDPDDNIQ